MSGYQQVTDTRDQSGRDTPHSLREKSERDAAGQERWKIKKIYEGQRQRSFKEEWTQTVCSQRETL